MGDFLGFEFGGVHSSELGITRVSGGDRYDEDLHPEIKDRTAEVPGLNGEYYFGSDYGPKNFELEIAFDSLTEQQFRRLRTTFGTKEVKSLIFDERPYKKYLAKLENPIQLSFVCFDEPKRDKGPTIIEGGLRVIDREYAQDNIIYASGDNLQLSFDMTKFVSRFPNDGTYIFTYQNIAAEDNSATVGSAVVGTDVVASSESEFVWVYGEEQINLAALGITYTGIPVEGDSITIELFTKLTGIIREDITPYITDYTQTQRIYKGEGKINLVCYFPFAKSLFKVLPEPGYKFYEGSKDWAFSSGMISKDIKDLYRIDECDTATEISVEPLNAGFSVTDEDTFKNRVRHTGIFHFKYIESDGMGEWYYDESSYPINLINFGITCSVPEPNTTYTITYTEAGAINVYNAGDLSTGFCVYLSSESIANGIVLSYLPRVDLSAPVELYIEPITIKTYGYELIQEPTGNPSAQGYYEFINRRYVLTQDTTVLDKNYYEQKSDIGILIDTNIGLIQGVKEIKEATNSDEIYNNNLSYVTSGTVYNEYINKGYFFKLEPNQRYDDGAILKITNINKEPITNGEINLFYDYLYF